MESPLSNLSKEAKILENGMWHNVNMQNWKNEIMHFLIALLKNVLFQTEN